MESMNEEDKTLIHISHLHPLKLLNMDGYQTETPEINPACHACHLPCNDQSYGCDECRYFLHIACATFTRKLVHPAHPAHNLDLHLTPYYSPGKFECDACAKDGYTFCFNCKECQFDLHLSCAAAPEKLIHPSHPEHSLVLFYENPFPRNVGTTAYCEKCVRPVNVNKWFYRCSECNYGGHMACFTNLEKAEEIVTDDVA